MNISIKEAKNRFSELVRLAESGEKVVITRSGKPVIEFSVPGPSVGGLNMEALRAYKKLHGIEKFVESIPEDFDDPLPEDFLLRPLP
jgi:antitoxin (DNA-binding transcriptional repressor) of toxin-antitoxin stability system